MSEQYSVKEMKERFQKYGVIYSNEEINENINHLIGLSEKKELMKDFMLALKKYEEIAMNFQQANITPNFTMLLYGPPGTGKTALTMALAKEYDISIGLVEADRLVSPLLGDTIKNIRNVFDLASDFAKQNGAFILFFDEIDAITGERANMHEVGEIKRAVISFLQTIDKVNHDQIPLAIMGATNHQHQLDSAVWRRFTYHLKFDYPNFIIRKIMIESFLNRIEKCSIGIDQAIVESLSEEYDFLFELYNDLHDKLGRDLRENEFLDLNRKLYQAGKADLLYATQGYTGGDLLRGTRVALFKAIQKSLMEKDDLFTSLQLVGGTQEHVTESQKLAGIANKGKIKSKSGKSKENGSVKSGSTSSDDIDDIGSLDIDL